MRHETEKGNPSDVFLQRNNADGKLTKEIIRFLKENVERKITVDDICETLHYNKSYLFRQFKAETGETIMSYYTRLKIERAKRLLRETSFSVAQIADKLAFDTPNYFSKTFKKLTGYTPLQYKKMHAH